MPEFNQSDRSESNVATELDDEEDSHSEEWLAKIEIVALLMTITYYIWKFIAALISAGIL